MKLKSEWGGLRLLSGGEGADSSRQFQENPTLWGDLTRILEANYEPKDKSGQERLSSQPQTGGGTKVPKMG